METSTKQPRDHYVPRLHLRLFGTGPGAEDLWRYDKQWSKFEKSTVGGSAFERGYYTVPAADGSPDRSLEEALNRAETPAIVAIRRVLALAPGRHEVTDEGRAAISLYVALQYGRVPAVRNRLDATVALMGSIWIDVQLSNPETYRERAVAAGEPDDPVPLEKQRQALLDEARRSRLTMKPPEGWSTVMPLSVAIDQVDPILRTMNWYLIHLPVPQLVIGDNPVVILPGAEHRPGNGVGPGSPGAEIYVPLGPDRLLAMKDEPSDGALTVLPAVRSPKALATVAEWMLAMNVSMWAQAERFVFARDSAALESVRNALGADADARPQVHVSGLEDEWLPYAGPRIREDR